MQNELNLKIQGNANEVDATLEKLISTLKKVDTTMNSVLKNASRQNPTKSIEEGIDRVTNKSSKLKSALNFAGVFAVTKKFGDFLEQSIDYSENLNLFNVALDELSDKGIKFQNTINEAFGTNQSETLRFQGIFQAMSKSMGIANDDAYKLSEGLTKIGFDLASLYNISDANAMNKLRAGLAGQTEPLRAVGMDVTENSLKPIIQKLDMRDSEGEFLTPRQLNYAEKMLLRYIAIVDQAKVSQGDFANTIEAPANQLKILGMQCKEAQRALGNLFVGALAKILPYAVAIVMVIKEVANAIAGVFGIEISDYNSGIGSLEDAFAGVEDSTSNIGSNLDDADKKAKKLQRTTMGFDEIHNISTPTSSKSSSDGDGGIGSGINPKLLAVLGEYENGMEKVRMKANAIRDAIMSWLGFTYDAEKGIWKFNKGLTPIKVILGAIGALLASKIIKGFKTLASVMGSGGLGKAVKWLLSPVTTLVSKFFELYKNTGNLSRSLKTTLRDWGQTASALDKVKLGFLGVATGIISLNGMSTAMKSVAENGWTLGNTLGTVASGLGGVASGAMIGTSIMPGLGTAVGAVAGGFISLATAVNSYSKNCEALKAYDRLFDGQGISIEALKNKLTSATEGITNYTTQILGYDQTQKNNNETIKEANNQIELYLGKLSSPQYKMTAEDLEKLKSAFENVKNATISSSEAQANAVIVTTTKLKEQGKISEETAQSVIDSAIRKQTAEGNSAEALAIKQKDLTTQYQQGKITYEQYTTQMLEAQKMYGTTGDEVSKLDTKFGILSDNISKGVNLENPAKLKELVSELNTTYSKQKEEVDKTYLSSKNRYENELIFAENELKNTQKGTEEYEKKKKAVEGIKEAQEKLTEQYTTDLSTLEGNYKGVFATLLTEIETSGNGMTKEVGEVKTEIEESLSKIGKDVDMTGAGKELFDSLLNDLVANENPFIRNVQKSFSKYGIEGGKAFENAVKPTALQNNSIATSYQATGKFPAQGYEKGIKSGDSTDKILGSGKYIGDKSINATKTSLDSHSPSKKYMTIGKDTIQGFIDGIKSKMNEVMKVIEELLSKMKKKFKDTKFSFNISTSVESSFNSLLSKLQTFCNRWRNAINQLASNMRNTMNSIKINGSGKVSYNSMPHFNIPRFADGGFPEDGLFYANHNELVGQFNNGKTAVANNEQIIEGIERGVYNAVVMAMSQNQGGQVVDINVKTEEGVIVEKAIRGINRETARTGHCPIKGV